MREIVTRKLSVALKLKERIDLDVDEVIKLLTLCLNAIRFQWRNEY